MNTTNPAKRRGFDIYLQILIVDKMNPNIMEAKSYLVAGGVVIMPTDTVYGLVGQACSMGVVKRIEKIKKRSEGKLPIVLIASIDDLSLFAVKMSPEQKILLGDIWPGPISVVLPVDDTQFRYLHKGSNTIAFRMPDDLHLRNLLKETGPLIATSANISGQPVVKTIKEAEACFGKEVDWYIEGKVTNAPSMLIAWNGDNIDILRDSPLVPEKTRALLDTKAILV
jgi:L-threonylcarbamoyladenylate synthase